MRITIDRPSPRTVVLPMAYRSWSSFGIFGFFVEHNPRTWCTDHGLVYDPYVAHALLENHNFCLSSILVFTYISKRFFASLLQLLFMIEQEREKYVVI